MSSEKRRTKRNYSSNDAETLFYEFSILLSELDENQRLISKELELLRVEKDNFDNHIKLQTEENILLKKQLAEVTRFRNLIKLIFTKLFLFIKKVFVNKSER